MYLPSDQMVRFLPQAKWFLRSWEEMQTYETANNNKNSNSTTRTDVLIVVAASTAPTTATNASLSLSQKNNNNNNNTLQQVDTALRQSGFHCTTTFRTDRMAPGACRLLGGYQPLEERNDDVLNRYKYGNAIESVVYAAEINALTAYDKLLRTDMDTFLTPAFAQWNPEKFIIGQGKYCFPQYTTCARLHRIARDMALAPPSAGTAAGTDDASGVVDNVGSTWYGDTATVIECAKLSVKAMRYLYVNEFSKEEKDPKYGNQGWPVWHVGVLSMYAGNIAINSCATKNNGFEHRPDMLDFASTSNESVHEHAHLHTWQNFQPFSKFAFFKGEYENVQLEKLDLNKAKDYAMYMALDANRRKALS